MVPGYDPLDVYIVFPSTDLMALELLSRIGSRNGFRDEAAEAALVGRRESLDPARSSHHRTAKPADWTASLLSFLDAMFHVFVLFPTVWIRKVLYGSVEGFDGGDVFHRFPINDGLMVWHRHSPLPQSECD